MSENTKYCDTSEAVIKLMMGKLNLSNSKSKILEPSAGTGKILEALPYINAVMGKYVDFCELNASRASIAATTGARMREFDFMDLKVDNKYSHIIAVPQYANNVWLSHTYKMYEHLLDGGKMVVCLPSYSLKEEQFVKWLNEKQAMLTFLNICTCDYICDTFILEIVKQ